MTSPVRILLLFEDRAFEDIVLPVAERVLADEGYQTPVLEGPLFTHGCRGNALKRALKDRGSSADLVLVGADTQQKTPFQKRKAMAALIADLVSSDRIVYALPQPSAEGWMQADLGALKRGIQEVLETVVPLPPETGSYPKAESRAKERLASILSRAGIPMLRGGLEYGPAVMAHADFTAHPSLEEFVQELRHWLIQRT